MKEGVIIVVLKGKVVEPDDLLDDIPIFIDREEVVERPQFKDESAFGAYLTEIAEGRDLTIVVAHPHDEDSVVLGIYIGDDERAPKCPQGCDDHGSERGDHGPGQD